MRRIPACSLVGILDARCPRIQWAIEQLVVNPTTRRILGGRPAGTRGSHGHALDHDGLAIHRLWCSRPTYMGDPTGEYSHLMKRPSFCIHVALMCCDDLCISCARSIIGPHL